MDFDQPVNDPAIALVGYLASDQRVVDDPNLSLADNKMQRGFALALSEQYSDVELFSTVPAWVGQGVEAVDAEDDGLKVRHLGTSGGRRRPLDKFFGLARELDRWATSRQGRPIVLLYYNTFLLYAAVGAWLRRRHGAVVVPIAITVPYRVPEIRASWLARIQGWATDILVRRANGIIAITPQLASELAPNVPSHIVRGGVHRNDMRSPQVTGEGHSEAPQVVPRTEPFRILYAGNLTPRYHLAEIIEMMSFLPPARYVLDIYGRGMLESMVREAARSSPNVNFHGAVDRAALPPLLGSADVLLALLRTDDVMAQMTFPSKLFESLASGTPTLTTDLATLEDGMRENLVVVDNLRPEHLARTVEQVCAWSPAQRRAAGEKAREFLLAHATWSAVGQRLRGFLDSMEGRR